MQFYYRPFSRETLKFKEKSLPVREGLYYGKKTEILNVSEVGG